MLSILEECSEWLLSKGINQWIPADFSRELLAGRIARGELFLARLEGEAAGTLTLQSHDDLWAGFPGEALYVHSLAVARRYAGMDLGRHLLGWAEEHAAASGRSYLRLDCWSGNRVLRAYYLKAGFVHRGDVEEREWAASLFEKELSG